LKDSEENKVKKKLSENTKPTNYNFITQNKNVEETKEKQLSQIFEFLKHLGRQTKVTIEFTFDN
jgi:hypothetical protein